MSIAVQDQSAIAQTVVATTDVPLPNIEVRFTPVYAWMTIGFGIICFFLGLLIALLGHHHSVGFGLCMCLISVAAAIGANYWRKHLHVVAQMTPRQLVSQGWANRLGQYCGHRKQGNSCVQPRRQTPS